MACVEQAAGAVVSEVHEPERDTLDPFRRVVPGFGRPVADVRAVLIALTEIPHLCAVEFLTCEVGST